MNKKDEEKNPNAIAMGKKGGAITAQRYGRDHYVRISKLGKIARAKNKPYKLQNVKLTEYEETQVQFSDETLDERPAISE